MAQATEDSSNSTPTPQTPDELTALARRLTDHADGIQNLAARAMADDMRAAARAIEQLLRASHDLRAEIRQAADSTADEATERHLRELLGGA